MTITYTPTMARRIVTTLFIAQCFGSAALIANATINAIVGATLSGRDALAGLPGTLLLIGAAGAAPGAGRLMQRRGRRPGLALGFFVGMAGMIIGGYPLLMFYNTLPSIIVYGTGKLRVEDFPKVGVLICAVACLLYSLCAATYWRWLGLF